jgi:hypothetical protein
MSAVWRPRRGFAFRASSLSVLRQPFSVIARALARAVFRDSVRRPSPQRELDRLSDHLRRDVGLPPRDEGRRNSWELF